MNSISEVDLSWLAGIIDGEGHIGIISNKRNGCKDVLTPVVTITNSNVLILQKCLEILEKIDVKYYYHSPRNSINRPLMRIRVSSRKSLQTLSDKIKPFLEGKKDMLQCIDDFLATKERSVREDLRNKIIFLNHHGHMVL